MHRIISEFNREHSTHYIDRLHDYMERELHPETAQFIGELVLRSDMLSAEMAMSIILQMQLDHIRKDADIEKQTQLNSHESSC